jgi:hypothetical protein
MFHWFHDHHVEEIIQFRFFKVLNIYDFLERRNTLDDKHKRCPTTSE